MVKPEQVDRTDIGHLELRQLNDVVTVVNVESLLWSGWQEEIFAAVATHAKANSFHGGEVQSSLEDSGFVTNYGVITGEQIEVLLPRLQQFYQGPIKDIVSKVRGKEVVVDPDKEFGANINVLNKGDKYECHYDINPVTALLAVTDINEGDGGELFHYPYRSKKGEKMLTRIKAGKVYIFEGAKYAHGVNELNPEGNAAIRITVPMDFVFPGQHLKRPRGMGKVLFGSGE